MKKSEAVLSELFDLSHTLSTPLLSDCGSLWEALPRIKGYISELSEKLSKDEYLNPAEDVWIHKTAKVFSSAYIAGPCIIGAGSEVRHCAFIRGSALIGEGCVVGNSTELKNVILFDGVQVPHYNYVGDSILGYRAHMGAGSITSNVRSDKALVKIHFEDGDVETGLKKFGAIIGDLVEVGCGTVLNPGTIVGRESMIYPLSSVRKAVSAFSVYASDGEIVRRR